MGERDSLPVRRTGKVLLLNEKQELLLFRAAERMPDGSVREIWFPVGGGAEGDESFAECAARELFEETGLRIAPHVLGDVIGVREGGFFLDGVPTWSNEVFFFASVAQWDVDNSGFTDLEREQLLEHRWWPLQELAETDRTVFPPGREIAELASRISSSGPPQEPVVLTWNNPPGWPRIDTQPHQESKFEDR